MPYGPLAAGIDERSPSHRRRSSVSNPAGPLRLLAVPRGVAGTPRNSSREEPQSARESLRCRRCLRGGRLSTFAKATVDELAARQVVEGGLQTALNVRLAG